MTSLIALVYASNATVPLAPADLDAILVDARAHNAANSVTGVLLHSGGAFLQYLEGSASAIARTFERIEESSRHENIDVLLRQPTDRRRCSDWQMGFCEAPGSVLQALAHAEWETRLDGVRQASAHSPGLAALMSFWKQSADGRR